MFGRLAAVAESYLRKGDRLFVSGPLRANAWASKDGSKRVRTEVVADNLIMLGGARKSEADSRNDAVVVEEIETDKNGEG